MGAVGHLSHRSLRGEFGMSCTSSNFVSAPQLYCIGRSRRSGRAPPDHGTSPVSGRVETDSALSGQALPPPPTAIPRWGKSLQTSLRHHSSSTSARSGASQVWDWPTPRVNRNALAFSMCRTRSHQLEISGGDAHVLFLQTTPTARMGPRETAHALAQCARSRPTRVRSADWAVISVGFFC